MSAQRYRELLETELSAAAEQCRLESALPPARRFRCEGILSVGLALGFIDADFVRDWNRRCAAAAPHGLSLTLDSAHNAIRLHYCSPRAPVYPSR